MTGAPDTEWWAGEAPVGAARRRDPDGAGSTQGNTRGNGSHANGRGATVPGPAPADRRPAGGTPPPATGLKRSTVQVFIPPPEELPPFEEVVDPLPPRRPRPARGPGGDVAGRPPAGRAAPDVPPAPDLGGRPGGAAAPAPDLDRVPSAPNLGRRPAEGPPAPEHDLGPGTGVPPGRDLDDDLGAPPAARGRAPSGEHRRRPIDRRRLAVVYDIDGPGSVWGSGGSWFMAAVGASAATAALALAVAVGLAARQVVRAWGSVQWQADLAAGLAALPVLARWPACPAWWAVSPWAPSSPSASPAARTAPACPAGAGGHPRHPRVRPAPGLAAGSIVLVRAESIFAAIVLVAVVSAYEMADFLVGSGAGNPIEAAGGVTTASLVAAAGGHARRALRRRRALLAVTAAACPLGQIAIRPCCRGRAPASALRRIDTLLVLAPVWAAASGVL